MSEDLVSTYGKTRILFELGLIYTLIMLVIWTPRPWQKVLWWFASGAVVLICGLWFKGLEALRLRREGFPQSLWVVWAALLLAAIALMRRRRIIPHLYRRSKP